MPEATNILLVLPSWVGDCVMATPSIRALRQALPSSCITALCLRNTKPLLGGVPWLDRTISYRRGTRLVRLAARLRRAKFDTAILLPNSFRTALVAQMAGIPRRVGFGLDARSLLLTDRLAAVREPGQRGFRPTLASYLELVRLVTGEAPAVADRQMQLFVTDHEREACARLLRDAGVSEDASRPWILLNPGAHNGPAKRWPASYFASVADRFATEMNATVLLSGSPSEHGVIEEIRQLSHRPIDLSGLLTLGTLKAVCGQVDLVITNDTGPRHIAAAMGSRVVSLFGPTDPRRTRIDYPLEHELFEPVFCGPCQRKTCPLDHRCMNQLDPERVYQSAAALLRTEARVPLRLAAQTGI